MYTAIVGFNGYGVFLDSEKLERSTWYLEDYETKEFTDVKDAVQWATSLFYKRQGKYQNDYLIDSIERIDWCYYRYRNPYKKRRRRS